MIDIVRDFLLEPVILIGVIVFIGLVLQRKGFEVVVKGTLKAMIGFMIISIGGNIISEAVASFGHDTERFSYHWIDPECRRNFRNCGGSLWNTDCSDHDPWNVGKSGSGKDHEIPLCVPDRTADALHGEHDRCRINFNECSWNHGLCVRKSGSRNFYGIFTGSITIIYRKNMQDR